MLYLYEQDGHIIGSAFNPDTHPDDAERYEVRISEAPRDSKPLGISFAWSIVENVFRKAEIPFTRI